MSLQLDDAYKLVIEDIERVKHRLPSNRANREYLISLILRNRDALTIPEPRDEWVDPYEGRADPEWA